MLRYFNISECEFIGCTSYKNEKCFFDTKSIPKWFHYTQHFDASEGCGVSIQTKAYKAYLMLKRN